MRHIRTSLARIVERKIGRACLNYISRAKRTLKIYLGMLATADTRDLTLAKLILVHYCQLFFDKFPLESCRMSKGIKSVGSVIHTHLCRHS